MKDILQESKKFLAEIHTSLIPLGLTTKQKNSLDSAIKDGYEFVTQITDTGKNKGSILIRDYEKIDFGYSKSSGESDRCALIDLNGKIITLTLDQFTKLEG